MCHLDEYLDQLTDATGCYNITVVYEACSSGCFIDELSQTGRIIVTSTGVDAESLFDKRGGVFSDYFLNCISAGDTIKDAFETASDSPEIIQHSKLLVAAGYPPQTPLLDDNGDKEGHAAPLPKVGDGLLAASKYIGTQWGALNFPPTITDVIPSQKVVVNTTITIWAVVVDDSLIEDMYANIIEPNFCISPTNDTLIVLNLTTLYLEDSDGDGNYTASFTPTVLGNYTLILHATDEEDNRASPKQCTITVVSPSDGKTVHSDTITVSGSATAMGGQVVESVTVNGMLASGTTSWSSEISLQAGSNTITVVATADTGNTATETITVIYSEQTPTSTPTPHVQQPPSNGGNAPLTPAPTPKPTGSILISTSPSGAEVYLDDSCEGITPINLDDVATGSHTIKIIKEGYISKTKTISWDAGKTINLDISLEPLTGAINVSSNPSGASVYLDGNYKGDTPLPLNEVIVGLHSIKLAKSGYGDVTKTVSVYVGETSYVHENLTGYGSLDVSTDPSGASVYLDGEYKGKTPLRLNAVVVGKHTIKLTKIAYADLTKEIQVSAGKTTPVSEALSFTSWLTVSLAIIGVVGISLIKHIIKYIKRKREE